MYSTKLVIPLPIVHKMSQAPHQLKIHPASECVRASWRACGCVSVGGWVGA